MVKNEPNDQDELHLQKLERKEYMENLKKWLDEARLWQYNMCALFPCNQNFHLYNTNLWFNQLSPFATNGNFISPYMQTNTQTRFPDQPPQLSRSYEFIISPLWKRALAEMVDFLLLFLFKMALTFLLLESFDIIDLSLYGFESFQKHLEDPKVAVPMAVELLTLELLHRVIVCAYEAYFLKGRYCATPGKRYMGLMVISAESISPVPGRVNETILATGASVLGWKKSVSRAMLKNLFVGLFLPLCVAFYIFPHNRTSYDMMSNSIVVEYNPEFMYYNGVA